MTRFFAWVCLATLLMGCETEVDPVVESRKLSILKNSHAGFRLDLDIREATVTYVVKPGPDAVNDPAGFYLQAHSNGGALFLPFGPEDLQPYPRVGDVLSFRVLEILDPELWMSGALWEAPEGVNEEPVRPLNPKRWFTPEEVTELRGFLEGSDPEMLSYVSGVLNGRLALIDYQILRNQGVEHLSADVTSDQGLSRNVDPYADRLVSIQGVLRSDFEAHGDGFRSALIGVKEQAAMAAIRVRVPEEMAERMDLRKGCTVKVGPTPLRRHKGAPIFSIYNKGEVVVSDCPAKSQVADLRTDNAPTEADQVLISELMVRAHSVTGRQGQWLELHNPRNGGAVNLKGCYLVPQNARAQHLIETDLELPPGSYKVLANSELPGGFEPDYTYDDAFDLRGEKERVRVALRCGRAVIAKVDLPLREERGQSYSLGAVNPDGQRKWCMASTVYNRSKEQDDRGTPGQQNDCP